LIGRYKAVAQKALALKLIRQPVEVDSWFEPVYVDRAVQTLRLQTYWTRYDAAGKPLS
jgi:sulfonate transport system substrate-binding protein